MISAKEFLDAIDSYLGPLLVFTFPGVVILDVIFHKGLFSGGIASLYDFLLYAVWAVAISAIYTLVGTIALNPTDLIAEARKKQGDLGVPLANIGAPLIIVLPLVTYVVYRVTDHYIDDASIIGISDVLVLFLFSFLVTTFASFPAAWLYKSIVHFTRRRFWS